MAVYEPNSNKYKAEQNEKQERPKMEPIVSGEVTKKKNGLRTFTDAFIREDISNIKQYIFKDVLIPGIKNAIVDIVSNGINMLMYGDSKGSGRVKSIADKVSYRSYYERRDDRRPTNDARRTYSYDDLIIPTRGEAHAILDRLCDSIDTYGTASVGDLYDLAGVTCDFTAYNYGWMNLSSAKVEATRGGYVLNLPRAVPIEK